jgi:hypothetical protein
MASENEHRPLAIAGRQTSLDPLANRVAMDREQLGHLFHRVGSVDLRQPRVWVPLRHVAPADLPKSPAALFDPSAHPFFDLVLEPADGTAAEADGLREGALRDP